MYKQCKSYSEQAECVNSLGDTCSNILKGNKFIDKDTRRVALSNIEMIACSGQMILNLLNSWTVGDEHFKNVIPQLLGLKTVTKDSVASAGNILNKTSKLNMVVLAQFQLETCLRNIAEELNVPTGGSGFYRMASNLINHLSLPTTLLDELNVPALIRNSLHCNGIHHGFQGSNTTTSIDQVTYEFINDAPVNCGSWEHISHALENSVKILKQIILTQHVSNISTPILDKFASNQ